MDPTRVELAAMQTVRDVLAWVPFRGPVADAFLFFLGVDADDPPRILAAMTEDMVQALLQQVTYEFEDNPYTLSPADIARLLRHTALVDSSAASSPAPRTWPSRSGRSRG